jgi:hypothetical protein
VPHLLLQEMTLEEYEKVLEEKRKALLGLKPEERKVEVDKELQSMQQLSVKKGADEIFIKLVKTIYQCSLHIIYGLLPFFLTEYCSFDYMVAGF